FSIQSDGTIEGSFTNGQTVAIGQIALANFPNTQGLLRVGSNNYMASLASGLPTVGVPGTGGRGTLTGGGLEGSNVDIASQFSKLILQQTGYEANAKAFTTFNTVVQATLNLVP
ncbi:MAG: flagellar hook-basal body complex protein, partial [Terriglobia bacterium]